MEFEVIQRSSQFESVIKSIIETNATGTEIVQRYSVRTSYSYSEESSQIEPPGTHPSEKTITLTLTSPAPGQAQQQLPPGTGTPLIVPTGLGGLTSSSSATGSIQHGPVSIHYAGPVLGTSRPPLLVSGGTAIPYPIQASPAKIPQQPPLQTSLQAPTTQSYVVSAGGNVCPDSGDEGVPSIHVANTITATPADVAISSCTPGPDGSHAACGQSEQRLKVEDALNYLDQVKYKFGNQPQVYNDFLDIMKEFKSQSIDTPGVISRVSHLFRGHPELIMGFNTFLPPGYKIEVQMSDQLPLGSMPHGLNYKVTTVHTTGIVNQHSTTLIQHTGPSIPVRSTLTHNSHPGIGTTLFGTTGGVNNGAASAGTVGIATSRAISPSPVRPPSLPPGGGTFETVGGSAFTHSLASPFVQNAFPTLQSQPVEFNHAINYVNKIKNRFHSQPDKYKQFLEILHTYQKEQRNKDGNTKLLTEHEVYNQVAKLFENQEDLLQEFGQFLPDATPPPPPVSTVSATRQNHSMQKVDIKRQVEEVKKPSKVRQDYTSAPPAAQTQPKSMTSAPKRSMISAPSMPTAKKVKYTTAFKDVTLAEAGKYGSLNDFAFFDRVRSMLRSNDVYDNFMRALYLYNHEVVSRTEVLQLVTPFLSRTPEMLAWFKDFLGHNEQAASQQYEPIQSVSNKEKLTEEQVLEIDFSTCKRLGASYCALPKNHVPPKCSGRTALCKEVLNDVWVSFPTWSEDSTFVTSRKTQFEEYIYRCEDERFELDVVIETNTETIRCLEAVQKRISRMPQEELQEFQLDDCLGGTSPTIHQRAIRRLYGEKASDIIEGLKKLPTITVPMVLRRLKAKEEEWREAQKGFNKIWREQVERFYLKSLDHQGINFKQGDIRALRSKALITEIETIYDERQEQNAVETAANTQPSDGPHLSLPYRDRSVLDDACNLLLHHVRRQSGIQKEDKRKIKQILKRFVPDLFSHPRMEMSDDETDDASPVGHNPQSPTEILMNGIKNSKRTYGSTKRNNGGKGKKDDECEQGADGSAAGDTKVQESRRTMSKRELKRRMEERKRQKEEEMLDGAHKMSAEEMRFVTMDSEQLEKFALKHNDQEENYRLFFANNTWYVFLRLHQILCERLTKLLETAVTLSQNEPKETRNPKSSASLALRLKPKPDIEIEEYYPTFLEMVRNLLDGNMETNTYEDQLREMFGIHAYIAYTMDKVVANAVRQLQNLVTDDACQKCMEFYLYADRKGGTGGSAGTSIERVRDECLYQCRSEKAFGEENCIKVTIFERNCEMTLELLDGEPTQPNPEEQLEWSSYVKNFSKSDGTEEESIVRTNPSFLNRNKRKPAPVTMAEVKKDPDTTVNSTPTASQDLDEPLESPLLVRIKDEPDVEVTGQQSNLQCSFNPSSYKMVYVCDGEDYLYRNRALARAKETHKTVSLSMWTKFETWHEDWLLKNTTRKDRSDCEAWLKENPKNEADVRAKRSLKVVAFDSLDIAPYHLYKKYVITAATNEKH